LPLALAVVAAGALTRPELPLGVLADQLGDARNGRGAFADEDPATDVRAVFSWSYRTLSDDAARLFRLLGLHPGPDVAAAAGLAAVPLTQTRSLLAELSHAQVIATAAPGRYTMHDLLRRYAAELARIEHADEDRRGAVHRMLDHYLHTSHTAALLLNPHRQAITLDQARDGVTATGLTDPDEAMGWFTAERPVLLSAVRQAAGTGYDSHVWQLAWTLTTALDRSGHWHDLVAAQLVALEAALRLADQRAQGRAHGSLGLAYIRLGRDDDAEHHFRHAVARYGQLGDRALQASMYANLCLVSESRGDHAQALAHAERAVELFRAAGHKVGEATVLNSVGWYHAQLGDYRRALHTCGQALTMIQELGDRQSEAMTWDSLGYAHLHLGDHDEAVACYQHALELCRAIGHRQKEAATLGCLGDVHQDAGNHDSARAAWQEAVDILDELGHADAALVHAKLDQLG
ncbi:MAG: tetratricopeptide repeat protein, partial [Micromonosporaceae bacterium]